KLYAALGRRGGRVVGSDLQSGSASFRVQALLPVAESFKFALELRTHTSGLAAPQMLFSHWEVIDIDPFWKPRTEEEYLHWGEKWDGVNRAKAYMDSVRARKGLATDKQLPDIRRPSPCSEPHGDFVMIEFIEQISALFVCTLSHFILKAI
ncbi:hypothetical protein HF086_013229, partial [Spodoptera exigua]